MEKQLKVRSYDYVNRPYEHVRDVLQKDALKVFQAATKAAASRAQTIASELHIEFGGIGVKTDINITVKSVEEKVAEAGVGPITRLLLEWEATAMPRLFPLMKGELTIYPLTSTETQLDFSGIYQPPFGPVGKTLNAIVGHRIAEIPYTALLTMWPVTFGSLLIRSGVLLATRTLVLTAAWILTCPPNLSCRFRLSSTWPSRQLDYQSQPT